MGDDAKKLRVEAVNGPASSKDPGVSDGVNHWPHLSDEVVLYILRLLPQKDLVESSLIDRRFRTLSRDDSLWTKLTLDTENIKQNVESCRKLVDRCKKLTSLKISTEEYQTQLGVQTQLVMTVVSRAKERLKCLEIDDAMRNWTPSAMEKLGGLQNLTSLRFTFSSEPYATNLYKGAQMLDELANLDQLEELQLTIERDSYYRPPSSKSNSRPVMKRVFKQLKKLKEVDIQTKDYDESLVATLAENNPNLRALRLKNYPFLSDGIIDVLANSCPGLEEFAISFEGEDAINKLSSSFPNLKRLEVGIANITAEKLTIFVEKFRSLESFGLLDTFVSVTDSGIERTVSSAENLKHLNIPWATEVTKGLIDRIRIENPSFDLRIAGADLWS